MDGTLAGLLRIDVLEHKPEDFIVAAALRGLLSPLFGLFAKSSAFKGVADFTDDGEHVAIGADYLANWLVHPLRSFLRRMGGLLRLAIADNKATYP
jgi:hypothetical protein